MTDFLTRFVVRMALCFAVASLIFIFTSGSLIPWVDGIPNCISVRPDFGRLAAGFVAIDGRSSLFISTDIGEFESSPWAERRDGHFCAFPVPPFGMAVQPTGFNLHFGDDAIAWTCPYWLMAVAWGTVFARARSSIRFSLADLLTITAVVAVVFALTKLEAALLLAIPLNLATALFFVLLLVRTAWSFFQDDDVLYPLLIPQQQKALPTTSEIASKTPMKDRTSNS